MDNVLKAEQRPEAESLLAFLKNSNPSVIQRWIGFMEGYEAGKQDAEKKAVV